MEETVLVIGATGYLGRHIVAELHRRGRRVRALVRSRDRAESPGAFGAPALSGLVDEWVVGAVTDPATVSGVCDGADRVVSALGVTRQKADPWDIDFRGNLAVLQEAEAAAARSFGYVGVLHADGGTSATLRAKAAFIEVLRRSRVTPQIINPSGYFSDLAELVAVARKGLSVHLGDGQTRLNPIHGEDLAGFVVDRLGESAGEWDVGGPDTYSYRELEALAAAAVGKKTTSIGLSPRLLPPALWVADRMGPRIGNLARFFGGGLLTSAVGEPTGRHHIGDYFSDLARRR